MSFFVLANTDKTTSFSDTQDRRDHTSPGAKLRGDNTKAIPDNKKENFASNDADDVTGFDYDIDEDYDSNEFVKY